ncbi:MAG: PilN domain-containing protein [Elusimicrobia bacterium]|nr:PilN domain-containing protein [Elusimicrobiota bacterium]
MIKINLLPREIYADKARRQLASLGVGIGVLVAALLLGFYGLLKKKEISLAKQMNEAKTEESKYQAIANDVQQLEVKKQQLSTRYDVIQRLVTGTLVYPKFFEDFMSLLPADVWIGSLSTSTDSSYGLMVQTSAQALSTFAIADWLTNLQSSPLCSDVRLGAISVTEDGEGRSVFTFQMNFTYRRSG